MRSCSTHRPDHPGIWKRQYDLPYLVFANVYVEGLTTADVAAIIELVILVLTLVGIKRASRHRESHLARLLQTQGIAYFVMVFLIHLTMIASGSGSLEICIR